MKNQFTVLLLEDDPDLAESLISFLENKKIQVIWKTSPSAFIPVPGVAEESRIGQLRNFDSGFQTGQGNRNAGKESGTLEEYIDQALEDLRNAVHLILLDWNLPDLDGVEWLKHLRRTHVQIPVLIVSVREMNQDIIYGLQAGADDYLVKPFSLDVLYARILAVMRRAAPVDTDLLTCGEIRLNTRTKEVFLQEKPVELQASEYNLLKIFMTHKNQILSREQLKNLLWQDDQKEISDNALSVQIKRLREKLNRPSCLKTLRALGYKLEDLQF